MPTDKQFELLFADRPGQHILGAQTRGFFPELRVRRVANHHNRQFWTKSSEPGQEVESIAVAASNIEQQEMRRSARLHSLHRFPAAGRCFQMPGVRLRGGTE